jgi:hypothetical protein
MHDVTRMNAEQARCIGELVVCVLLDGSCEMVDVDRRTQHYLSHIDTAITVHATPSGVQDSRFNRGVILHAKYVLSLREKLNPIGFTNHPSRTETVAICS